MKSKKQPYNKRISKIPDEELPFINLGIRAGEFVLTTLSLEETPWYESPEEIEAALGKSIEVQVRVKALVKVMRKCLTASEFKAMRLHYLHNMSYRQAGLHMGRNASTVYRYVQRGIKKIRVELEVPEG